MCPAARKWWIVDAYGLWDENWCRSAASVFPAGWLTLIHILGNEKRFSVWVFFLNAKGRFLRDSLWLCNSQGHWKSTSDSRVC